MKKIFIFILSFLVSLNFAFALKLQWDIKLEKATSNSLKISWDKVDWAIWYFVYYDTVSHKSESNDIKNYKNSTDLLDSTGTNLNDLEPNTKYYLAVTVADENWNEWEYSKEFSFSTTWEKNKKLILQDVKVISKNKIRLIFNVDIDSKNNLEFKIENKKNNLDIIWVKNVDINWNNVELTLNKDLSAGSTYLLTVVSASGKNWETIQSWIDWLKEFNTENLEKLSSADSQKEQKNNWDSSKSTWKETNSWNDEKKSDINEQKENNKVQKEEAIKLWWKNLKEEEIKKNAELASKKSKKLPKTWPAEWGLLLMSLFLWLIFVRKKAKA